MFFYSKSLILLRYLLLSLLVFSNLAFAADKVVDKTSYEHRFSSVLKSSQTLTIEGFALEETTINKQWLDLLRDYPTDKSIANNYAVFLMKVGRYLEAKEVLEKALSYEADTKLLVDNINKVNVRQAQQAYKTVFSETEVSLPVGKWSAVKQTTSEDNIDLTKIYFLQLQIDSILNQVENWRFNWEKQDVNGYLDFYKMDYVPSNFTSNSDWKVSRKYSLTTPKFIKIDLLGLFVFPLTDGLMQVEFIQDYHSNKFKDKVKKILIWKLEKDKWKIINERVVYK